MESSIIIIPAVLIIVFIVMFCLQYKHARVQQTTSKNRYPVQNYQNNNNYNSHQPTLNPQISVHLHQTDQPPSNTNTNQSNPPIYQQTSTNPSKDNIIPNLTTKNSEKINPLLHAPNPAQNNLNQPLNNTSTKQPLKIAANQLQRIHASQQQYFINKWLQYKYKQYQIISERIPLNIDDISKQKYFNSGIYKGTYQPFFNETKYDMNDIKLTFNLNKNNCNISGFGTGHKENYTISGMVFINRKVIKMIKKYSSCHYINIICEWKDDIDCWKGEYYGIDSNGFVQEGSWEMKLHVPVPTENCRCGYWLSIKVIHGEDKVECDKCGVELCQENDGYYECGKCYYVVCVACGNGELDKDGNGDGSDGKLVGIGFDDNVVGKINEDEADMKFDGIDVHVDKNGKNDESENHVIVDVDLIETENLNKDEGENINTVNVDINQAENNQIKTPSKQDSGGFDITSVHISECNLDQFN